MIRLHLASLCLFALAACGPSTSAALVTNETTNGVWDVEFALDHHWFPLHPGRAWSYAGEEDGHTVGEEVAVQPTFETVDGVRCVVVIQERLLDDEIVETTLQWFSGDREGNVWLFGEQSSMPGTAEPLAADSWLAGQDGATALLWLPAHPEVGEILALPLPHGSEQLLVVALDGKAAVPAGRFTGCLAIAEESGGETDLILYAPGIGRVQETSPGSTLRLVESR